MVKSLSSNRIKNKMAVTSLTVVATEAHKICLHVYMIQFTHVQLAEMWQEFS